MSRALLRAFLPPLVLALILGIILVLPKQTELLDSAISPDLPLERDLPGWYGIKQQESELERLMLAGDTRFSKAAYVVPRYSVFDRQLPPVIASIVYSGSDMNASIHRPERCLPSQGHIDLRAEVTDIPLSDGRSIRFTRLSSRTPIKDRPGEFLNHINYYVFIGRSTIRTSHLDRTLQDMFDRSVLGVVQRWAYYQIGTYWGGDTGVGEEEADAMLRKLIGELTPGLIDWNAIR